jgi:signal transduction histidine kinase
MRFACGFSDSLHPVNANGQAVGVIPHTLLDNALKYGPRGSRVEVYIDDDDGHVLFAVRSLGPMIHAAEINRTFVTFYRGEAARRTSEEGAGYRLYVSQLVAKEHLDTEITVTQESSTNSADEFYSTEFSVRIPLKAKILV